MYRITDEFPIEDWAGPVSEARQQAYGIKLHKVEVGEPTAPLVILLHGFADFWWSWRRQLGPLAQAGFRVIAPDQRGYNLSDKPISVKAYDLDSLAMDVVSLAESFGYKKFSIIGHDFGGLLSWWIASRFPDRVEKVISINSFHPQILGPYLRKNPKQLLRSLHMSIFQLPWLPEWLLKANDFAIMKQLFKRCTSSGTFTSADFELYKRTWQNPGALTGMINWYRALRHKPFIENLRVKVPTLIIWGDKDVYLNKGLAEESLKLCDDGRILSFVDGNHYVHIEEFMKVNDALIAFLKSKNQTSSV